MKKLFLSAMALVSITAASEMKIEAQERTASPPLESISHSEFERSATPPAAESRPSMIRGYGDFNLAPPHNELDAGLCGTPSSQVAAPCTAFARYMASGYVEIRPFVRWSKVFGVPLSGVYLFGDANLLLGNNIPQQKYTWSPQAIGIEKSWGLVASAPHGFEVRITQHPPFSSFRKFNQANGYIGSNGPWGRYNIVGVRKYFGYRGSGGPE